MINATAICLEEKGIKNTVGENKQIVNYIKECLKVDQPKKYSLYNSTLMMDYFSTTK